MLVLGDLIFGFRLVVVFLVLVPNTYVLCLLYSAISSCSAECVSCVLLAEWPRSLMLCLSPVKSSVLLETVVYFEFCTSVPMSVFKWLCLYSFSHWVIITLRVIPTTATPSRCPATPLRWATRRAVTPIYMQPLNECITTHQQGTQHCSLHRLPQEYTSAEVFALMLLFVPCQDLRHSIF